MIIPGKSDASITDLVVWIRIVRRELREWAGECRQLCVCVRAIVAFCRLIFIALSHRPCKIFDLFCGKTEGFARVS